MGAERAFALDHDQAVGRTVRECGPSAAAGPSIPSRNTSRCRNTPTARGSRRPRSRQRGARVAGQPGCPARTSD
jgi:hypothetical protein